MKTLFKEDLKSVKAPFWINGFEISEKKIIHFLTDGIKMSVKLGEKCVMFPKHH